MVGHSERYVSKVVDELKLDKNSFVLEVASNDGYLLKNFLYRNIPCLGIEPTKSTAREAIKAWAEYLGRLLLACP